MQKAQLQKQQEQPASRNKGSGIVSPQSEQIAQLQTMIENSPQVENLSGLAAMMNASPAMTAQKKSGKEIDNSPGMGAQRKQNNSLFSAVQRTEDEEPLQGKFESAQRIEDEETLQGKFASDVPAQREAATPKTNNTGLPDNLKSGIENLSGMSMDHVKVHYNSPQPAQLNALAYAQGSDIHVAPGQEQHLPHEAWHVVQQAQGRVQPTMQMKAGVPVNDDAGLEHEADVMGNRAMQLKTEQRPSHIVNGEGHGVLQRKETRDYGAVETKKLYGAEIDATGTAEIIPAVNASMSEGSGVFLSDNIGEWQQWMKIGGSGDVHKLVLPDIATIKVDQSGYPSSLANNGQSIEQNCSMIAEHELTHLKHASVNVNKGLKGAGTDVAAFSNANITATINGLILSAGGLFLNKSGMEVARLVNAKNYVIARLGYILSDWNTNGRNSEAPAVMRELHRYLGTIVREDDHETWIAFKKEIDRLDKLCSESIGMVKKSGGGGCFITTASCEIMGKTDDCYELTVLRAFRDGYMATRSEGNSLIEEYYRIAPTILKQINLEPQRTEILQNLFHELVTGSIKLITGKREAAAMDHYKTIVLGLKEKYLSQQKRK